MESVGAYDVSFDNGTVQPILAGYLMYNASMCLSNLSIFCFYEKLEDGEDKSNRVLLWVIGREGRKRTKDEINKSLRQVIVTPRNYAEIKNQLVIFMFVTQNLFGVNSTLPLALKSLYNTMLKYYQS